MSEQRVAEEIDRKQKRDGEVQDQKEKIFKKKTGRIKRFIFSWVFVSEITEGKEKKSGRGD